MANAKINYGKTQYKNDAGVLVETKSERIFITGTNVDEFTKIAQAGGDKVYYNGTKKGIALSMEAANEALASAKGLKGKEFVEALKSAVVAKYGDLGEKGRVDFTNTVYFKDGEKHTTKEPRVVLTSLSQEAFTKVAQDKGQDVYVEGIKSGISLSMTDANEALKAAAGTKGHDFFVKLEEFVSNKYGIKFGATEQEIADNEASVPSVEEEVPSLDR